MHVVCGGDHQLMETPECIFISCHEHEQESSNLWHPLAVTHLDTAWWLDYYSTIRYYVVLLSYLSVVHTVGCQYMKQVFLFDVVSFSEHVMIPVCSVYIKINLSDLFTKVSSTLSRKKEIKIEIKFCYNYIFSLHFFIDSFILFPQLINIQQYAPDLSS